MSTPAAASASSLNSRDLLPVFNALPGAYMLLSPELLIEAASDEYLAATLTTRAQLVGRLLFNVFPDNPAAPEAHATRNLRASLAQVLATGQPHQMAPQHYDVPDPAHPSQFVERHWLCTNRPVRDANDQVVYLLHSAVDITDQYRAEGVLLDTQAAEQGARAEAELQRGRFYEVLMALPALVATYHGPDHTFNFVNTAYQRYFPTQALPGRSLREVLPEAETHGVLAVMDRVYQTGEPSYQQELEVWLDHTGSGQPRQLFLNLLFHPLRNAQGQVDGLLDFSYDVTEQVLARRQVEQFNHELEARVQERTHEAEHQRARLESVFRQAPAAIAVCSGPDFVFELVNPVCQALLPDRSLLGKSMRDAFPEVARLPIVDTLRQVYETGVTHHEPDQLIPVVGPDGTPENRYFNFTLQARYDEQHRVDGVVGFGFETTAQVAARRQAETLQAQLLTAAQHQAAERLAFFHIFEQAPVLVAMLRAPGHRFEYVNPAYQALFPGRQLVGREVAEAVPEMQVQGFVTLMDQVYQTGETYTGRELPFMVPGAPGQPSRPAYYDFTYQAYRENGEVAGLSVFAFDVTEQVLARQEREAQRQELEQLFRQAPTPIVILDGPDLVFQLVNPAYQQIFPGRVLAGKPLLAALPELVGTPIPDLFQHVYQTGEPVTIHELPLQMARHEGHALEEIYWTFTYQARRTDYGLIDGVRVFAQDVTESVRARQASEASAQRLRLLTDALPVLIGYLDRERRYQFANEAYRTWFNQDPAELLGRKVIDIVGEKAYATTAGYMDRALAGERFDFEATMPYREGFTRHIRTSYIPDVQQGVVRGFYTLVNDITEQVEARQQVERLNQELAAINEQLVGINKELHHTNTQLLRTNTDLDTFVYAASHDLKAPIANIEGLLEALRVYLPTQEEEPMVPQLVSMMEGAITRFQQTVGHLTDVSRLQSEGVLPLESSNLAAVLDDVRLDLLPLLNSTRAELVLDLTACPRIALSTKHLRSVLFNLLSNAVKYRAPDRLPVVHMRTQCTATHLELEVQDNGLGLDATQQTQLFTMFRRLHTHVEGSGVGLYLIKRTLENAGGTIAVRSQPGVGSTFTVTIPRA